MKGDKKMKNIIFALTFGFVGTILAAPNATVTSVSQNWPWDAKVTINYTLTGEEGVGYDVKLKLNRGFDDALSGALRGDLTNVQPGDHSIEWNPEVDALTNVVRLADTGFVLEVAKSPVTATTSAKKYLVVDISQGANAETWPVVEVDEIDLTDEQYKTTKLVLTKVRAGKFMQSSPEDEPFRKNTYELRNEVTLTNDYWMGVYELTQKQYELITGVAAANGQDAYPCHSMKFTDVRGANVGRYWPSSSDVDADSLIGILRKKAVFPASVPLGWKFDLPTDAQWEYACRAGTDSAWNNGTGVNVITNSLGEVVDPNLDKLGWYAANSGGKLHKVGLKYPNAFGLYDMHGNVWEMTLGVIHYTNTAPGGIEPLGRSYNNDDYSLGGSYRVVRGGCYKNKDASYYADALPETAIAMCRAAARSRMYENAYDYIGVRLVVRYSLDNAGHNLEQFPPEQYPYQ